MLSCEKELVGMLANQVGKVSTFGKEKRKEKKGNEKEKKKSLSKVV